MRYTIAFNTVYTAYVIHKEMLSSQINAISSKLQLVLCNGPFAASGHMVQNPPCWRASCPLGHPEQSDFIKINLHFLCFECPSA